jgi:hypothetical protein
MRSSRILGPSRLSTEIDYPFAARFGGGEVRRFP